MAGLLGETNSHGILQSSLEENFAEIRRLNKVVVQLQALLIERDGRAAGALFVGHDNDTTTTTAAAAIASGSRTLPLPQLPPSVVTPPTPPGLDYLPVALGTSGLSASSRAIQTPATVNPRAYDTTSGSGDAFGPPPMLRTQSDYAFGMGMMPPAPPMMSRTRSDYGYRFPSPTSHQGAAATDYAHSLSAQSRYTLPPMYQQQQQHHHAHVQQSEDSQEVLAISPSQLSSSPVMPPSPNRTRSTTWPSLSSLVAADHATASTSTSDENPFALPLPFSSDPSQNQSQRYQSTTNQSISIPRHHQHHPPPPTNNCDLASSSPHSLKLDAAVTLAKGLAAAKQRSFAMALDDDEDDDEDGLSQRHRYPVAAMDRLEVEEEDLHVREEDGQDDDDLYALPIPPPGCGPATAAAGPTTELAQLATTAVSRQGSVDCDGHTSGNQSLFATAPEKKGGPGMLDSQQSSSAAGTGYSFTSASAPPIVTDADGTTAEDPTWLFKLPQY